MGDTTVGVQDLAYDCVQGPPRVYRSDTELSLDLVLPDAKAGVGPLPDSSVAPLAALIFAPGADQQPTPTV